MSVSMSDAAVIHRNFLPKSVSHYGFLGAGVMGYGNLGFLFAWMDGAGW